MQFNLSGESIRPIPTISLFLGCRCNNCLPPWIWSKLQVCNPIQHIIHRNITADWMFQQSTKYINVLCSLYLMTEDDQMNSGSCMLSLIVCDSSCCCVWSVCVGIDCLSSVRMVASYLVHHSYCATAEAFAKSTDQAVHEELASIKNRQSESFHGGIFLNNAQTHFSVRTNRKLSKCLLFVHCRFAEIQKLVLSGRMGEAIETTQQLYPNLLERNPDLLFMLK